MLIILIFACPVFSQTDSNKPDLILSQEPRAALADVNSVWTTLYLSKTPGVPYIPDPCLDYKKIRERLKLAEINLVSMPLVNRNTDAPLPANLRMKIYIHNFNITEPYIFHIELAVARPVVIPSIANSPFYAEIWHSRGVIDTSSEQDLQEKINKALIGQLDFLLPSLKGARSASSKPPTPQDPNRPSPKLSK